MKLKAKDIKVGMHLTHGEVIRSDSQLNAWVIITADGFDRKQRYLLPDAELEVTAVLGKHVKRGMRLVGYGEVIGTFVTGNPVYELVDFVRGRSHLIRDRLFTLAPVPPNEEPQKVNKFVLASGLKNWMSLDGYGVISDVVHGEFSTSFFSPVKKRLVTFGSDCVFKLQTDTKPATVGVDPEKHLQWAIDNKDWAQARAALTELEKN